jgi:hypothetical protein
MDQHLDPGVVCVFDLDDGDAPPALLPRPVRTILLATTILAWIATLVKEDRRYQPDFAMSR